MTDEIHPSTSEENLLEQYLDVVERHGVNSKQAAQYRETHKETQGFNELVKVVSDMEATRQNALWGRRVVTGVWIAAVVLVGVIGWVAIERSFALAAPFWGLNQPNALAALETSASPAAYYGGAAKIAGQGADRWPKEAIPLAQRITEYRLGCTRLLFAEKRPLTAMEKEQLNSLCRRWSEQLDNNLEKLDRGVPVAEVSANVDGIVKQIVSKLQERATELEAAPTTEKGTGQ